MTNNLLCGLILRLWSRVVFLLFGFIFCVLVYSPSALAAEDYSLPQAIADAISLSGEVASAVSEELQAKEGLRQAYGYNLPSVTANSDFGQGKDRNEGRTVSNQDGTRYSVNVQVDQNLYSFGRVDARINSASAGIRAARYLREAAEGDTAEQASLAYAAYVFRADIVALRRDYRMNIEQQLVDIQRHIKAGTSKRTEVARLRARFFEAEADLLVEEAQLQAAADTLWRLTGKAISEGGYRLSGDSLEDLFLHVPNNLAESIERTLIASPAVQRATADFERAQADSDFSSAELWPSVGVRAVASISDYDDVRSSQFLTLLTGNLPIYEGGIRRSQARQAKEAVNSASKIIMAEKDRVSIQVGRLWAQVRGYANSRKALMDALDEAQNTVNDIQAEVNAGSLPVIALTQAQKDLLDIEIVIAESILQHFQVVIGLVKEVGALTRLQTEAAS